MNHFHRTKSELHAERVPLSEIAERFGTPTYVYSTATLTRHLKVMRDEFQSQPTLVCYAVKACSTLSILKLFAKGGSGFDIVSGGELQRVLKAGGDAKKVVFSGVGKTEDEMALALKAGILMFNVESADELRALDAVAKRMKKKAPFALRVNPDVDAKTHKYIATGLKTSKFGVPFEEAVTLYRESKAMTGLVARGIDCHIGSQLTDTAPMTEAVAKVAGLYRSLQGEGFALTHLDVGGGLGVTYTTETPPSVPQYARAVLEPLRGLQATLVLEPGRVLVANAGVLVTKVLYRKGHFVIVDAGMNDLLRPALYEAHHDIVPVKLTNAATEKVDVVGPVCETSDTLGKARDLPLTKPNELLAVMTAGAYGMSMASNYNSRCRPAEVLVDGKKTSLIRRRETFADLVRGES